MLYLVLFTMTRIKWHFPIVGVKPNYPVWLHLAVWLIGASMFDLANSSVKFNWPGKFKILFWSHLRILLQQCPLHYSYASIIQFLYEYRKLLVSHINPPLVTPHFSLAHWRFPVEPIGRPLKETSKTNCGGFF